MEKLMLFLQHGLNPLHLYCRLRDIEIDKEHSLRISRYYEICVYRWLVSLTNLSIALCRLSKRKMNGHKVMI